MGYRSVLSGNSIYIYDNIIETCPAESLKCHITIKRHSLSLCNRKHSTVQRYSNMSSAFNANLKTTTLGIISHEEYWQMMTEGARLM